MTDWDEEPAEISQPMLAGKNGVYPAKALDVESFETAQPVPINRASFTGPAEPESYVIGCCLLDEGHTLDKALSLSLHPSDFRTPSNALIYGTLSQMRKARDPIDLGTLYEHLGSRAESVGGITALMALADPLTVGTTARADHYINRLLQDSANRREVNKAKALLERAEKGEDVATAPAAIPVQSQRTPSSFLLTPDDDSSVLLGNRFLNRGDGGILVGSSGMGKSSASIQMSVSWALGLPFMGIKSNGALKILIIQSEDSDGDIAEVMLSMRHMLKLTEAQVTQVDQNIRIVCDRVSRGKAFIAALKAHIKEFQPDLVIINPLQAFIDGDVTESRDLGQFLREGLNGLNDGKFGYLLIHHTTKPATGRDKNERQWHEVMYDMAGGAELINWARFVMSLRAAPTPCDFNLVLAKRGRRAGVTREVPQGTGTREEIVTTIPLRHAQGSIEVPNRRRPVAIIFWEEREPDQKAEDTAKMGRPEKYSFNDYRNVFPSKDSRGKPLNEIYTALMANGFSGQKKNLPVTLKRWSDQGDIEVIQINGEVTRYRATL
jgi:hypothetical protein